MTSGLAGAVSRFEYFVARLAKLRLWQDTDNFESLKQIAQKYMDDLRHQCDRLYEAMRQVLCSSATTL